MSDDDDVVHPEGEIIDGASLRGWLDASFEKAERLDLEPEWHEDRLGFSCICMVCRQAGEENHRGDVRPQPIAVIPISGIAFFGSLPRTPNDSATGPAG